jgi:hypothetical protein
MTVEVQHPQILDVMQVLDDVLVGRGVKRSFFTKRSSVNSGKVDSTSMGPVPVKMRKVRGSLMALLSV